MEQEEPTIRFADRSLAKHDADLRCALTLFWGVGRPADRAAWYKKVRFPSAKTKPTEKEARAALARLLLTEDPPKALLLMLAHTLDPDVGAGLGVGRRVKFENKSQGHSDSMREIHIACMMRDLVKSLGYGGAAAEAGAVGTQRQTGQEDLRQVQEVV